MSIWTILWITWGVVGSAIELVAVFNDVGDDTLSEHLRKWFRVDTHIGRTVWLVFSFLFFVVWFIPHIAN